LKNRRFVIANTIVAALGGFLFGFDTAVISGTTGALERVFYLDDVCLDRHLKYCKPVIELHKLNE